MKKFLWMMVVWLTASIGLVWAEEPHITVRYEGNAAHNGTAQLEIVSGNERLIMDLFEPGLLSAPPVKNDILLGTSDNYYVADYIRDFPGDTLLTRVGEIKRKDIYVRGIASNRDDKTEFLDEHGTNYIFLVETAGIRVANLGYIGQSKLTPEQINQLGEVDILFLPFYNFRNGMSIYDRRGFNLVEQIHPRIVIPTGLDLETAEYAVKQWLGFYMDQMELKITHSKLPEQTSVIFMGPDAKRYGKVCKVPKFN